MNLPIAFIVDTNLHYFLGDTLYLYTILLIGSFFAIFQQDPCLKHCNRPIIKKKNRYFKLKRGKNKRQDDRNQKVKFKQMSYVKSVK